jgi:hypothetical protein
MIRYGKREQEYYMGQSRRTAHRQLPLNGHLKLLLSLVRFLTSSLIGSSYPRIIGCEVQEKTARRIRSSKPNILSAHIRLLISVRLAWDLAPTTNLSLTSVHPPSHTFKSINMASAESPLLPNKHDLLYERFSPRKKTFLLAVASWGGLVECMFF